MDYRKWSDEYFAEAEKILRNIEVLKKKLINASFDEAKNINSKIVAYRFIYYEVKLTARHLLEKAEAKRCTEAM